MSRHCENCRYWSGDETTYMAECRHPDNAGGPRTEYDHTCPLHTFVMEAATSPAAQTATSWPGWVQSIPTSPVGKKTP